MALPSASGRSIGFWAASHQPVEEGDVAGAGHGVEQGGPGHLPLLHQPADDAGRARGVVLGQGGGLAPEPLEEDVGVADGAQGPAQPLQLAHQLGQPLRVEERLERLQVGAQAAGADPGLVDVLGVVADAHAGVVAEDADDGGGHGARGPRRPRSRRRPASPPPARPARGPAPRAPAPPWGSGSTGARPGPVQGGDHRLQQGPAGVRLQLHLDLAEAAGQLAALVDRHLVVDHLGQAQALGVEQLDAPADGAQAGGGHQAGAAGVGPDQAGHLRRHRGRRRALEGELPPHEGGPVVAVGQLDRPPGAVAGAVAQAGAPPGQAEVGRVEVDGVELAVGQGTDGDPVEHAGEVGQGEPGPGAELGLPLPCGLHGV